MSHSAAFATDNSSRVIESVSRIPGAEDVTQLQRRCTHWLAWIESFNRTLLEMCPACPQRQRRMHAMTQLTHLCHAARQALQQCSKFPPSPASRSSARSSTQLSPAVAPSSSSDNGPHAQLGRFEQTDSSLAPARDEQTSQASVLTVAPLRTDALERCSSGSATVTQQPDSSLKPTLSLSDCDDSIPTALSSFKNTKARSYLLRTPRLQPDSGVSHSTSSLQPSSAASSSPRAAVKAALHADPANALNSAPRAKALGRLSSA